MLWLRRLFFLGLILLVPVAGFRVWLFTYRVSDPVRAELI